MNIKPRKMQPLALVMAIFFTGTGALAETTPPLTAQEKWACEKIDKAAQFQQLDQNHRDCIAQGRDTSRCDETRKTKQDQQFQFCANAKQKKLDTAERNAQRAAQPKTRRP